ncbi:MAG: YIP1 family protein [Phycisphaerae bacterium]
MILSPRRVFARVEDVPAWGWPLVILLTTVTLIGYATVQTGLIDREVERGVRASIAQIDAVQRDVTERSELRELYAQERKMGEFKKLLARMRVIGAEPATALASVLLIAAVLYGAVALTGHKPEWHTLLTICVLASFADVMRLLLTLGLMLHFATLEVYTSLAPLTRYLVDPAQASPTTVATIYGSLAAVDPFRLWFWLLVVIGLKTTAQLRGWRAWVVCTLCFLVASGVRMGLLVASAAVTAGAGVGTN